MILCCGEALIDFLPRKGADGAFVYQPFNGGSIYNTAIALGRLDVPTGFLGGISTDFFGDGLAEGLAASNVDLRYVKRKPLHTTLAFVKLVDGHARYSFVDDASAARNFTKKDLPKLPKAVKALHFGSISLIPEPCGASYEALLKREHKSRVICIDPNIRASLIKEKKKHLERLYAMISRADILKISDEDVLWMSKSKNLAKFAAGWVKRGVKLVAITKGGEGVEVYTKDFSFTLNVPKTKVVDTVGAGDTFTAGLLAYLEKAGKLTKKHVAALDEATARDAATYAMKAAAV
ncbi:MAG: carbohydrate kinase, partial [Alphaproteobacteria bacterium]|nr:carbohydrate kinase [Alphaproteobacteria bacterium]